MRTRGNTVAEGSGGEMRVGQRIWGFLDGYFGDGDPDRGGVRWTGGVLRIA